LFQWTENHVRTLKLLWQRGDSAREIALHIDGASRDAVIGKARRLGLARRPSPIKINPARAFFKRNGYYPFDLGFPGPRECLWPIGEPGQAGFRFCCKRRRPR